MITLSKGANLLELQVQSIVARVKFSHEGTRDLISNSRGIFKKAIVLLQATCKTISCLVSPTPLSGCQAQGVNVSKIKYDNKCNKVTNNTIN
jgi:hypothetical protein